MRVVNLGSLNIDLVYRVPHIVRPGETLASHHCQRCAGGKGANQSVALARAGANVLHLGVIGTDGSWLRDTLAQAGVLVEHVHTDTSTPSGHAIIQVADDGENSIVLFPGTNQRLSSAHVAAALAHAEPGDVLLVQNETNQIPETIRAAKARGLRVWANPAPMTAAVAAWPLDCLDTLVVNASEGLALSGLAAGASPAAILEALAARLPDAAIVLTLGAQGACAAVGAARYQVPARSVQVVDTTAAGDTFVGYALARTLMGDSLPEALTYATHAAALTVSRVGAIPAIPLDAEVRASLA